MKLLIEPIDTGFTESLPKIIKKVVGYKGDIIYDASLPDGVRNKLQDVSTINDLGWKHQVELEQGICLTYQDFLARIKSVELINV